MNRCFCAVVNFAKGDIIETREFAVTEYKDFCLMAVSPSALSKVYSLSSVLCLPIGDLLIASFFFFVNDIAIAFNMNASPRRWV